MNTFKKPLCRIVIFVMILSIMIAMRVDTTMAQVDLTDPVFDFDDILFIKRERLENVESAGNHMCDQYFGHNQIQHSKNGLYILENAFSGSPTVRNVLENSYCTNGRYEGQKLEGGAFLSPDLSYDGTQIVFAYTDAYQDNYVWNENTTFHIFKVNIDGTGLTQLTDGSYNDFDPCWLPDGDIVFISERRGGYGRCHQRPVPTYTLHRMEADGSNIRCISYHETNEWNPSVDNNGMVIYTRWDYVDRGATHMHSAWITKPDGLDARPITLNYPLPQPDFWDLSEVPLMQMSLRAIPNSNKYVGTAAPHHGQNYGSIIVIDPDIEDDDSTATFVDITPDNGGFPESGSGGTKYATPYPLSEEYFLCVYDSYESNYGIYVINASGDKELLYRDPDISCLSPIPVRPRPKPNALAVSEKPDGTPSDGIVMLANVYDSLLTFPEGTNITHLRIWQVYPKSTALADDPSISYEATESDWAGRNARGLLGTVPVESDGSAHFYLPPGKAVFFQAVDDDGTAVQTMRSDTFVVPGQHYLSCQGCHEPRHTTPKNPTQVPLAMRREPSTIQPETVQGARPLSFPRLIQPILDNKCISCHDGSQQTPDLRKGTPDSSTQWFQSYINLRPYVFLFDEHYTGANWDRVYPRTEPGVFGARQSSLYSRLRDGHGNLTADELHSFVLWMDSGVAPFFGDYNNIDAQLNGEQVEPILD